MLITLTVQNFGIIENLLMEFDRGLNVLTGETGAGKSIVLDALSAALGGRCSPEAIRYEQKKALVETQFYIDNIPRINNLLIEAGLEPEEDGTLIMTREINRSGKNLCRINGRSVVLSIYREIGKYLIDMHGQHQQQSLLDIDKQRELLDAFGGKEHLDLLTATGEAYRSWQMVYKECKELTFDEQEKQRKTDMLLYQIEEINKAQLKPGEDVELAAEFNILLNAEKIIRLINESYNYLYEGSSGTRAVTEQLSKTVSNLETLQEYGAAFIDMKTAMESMLYQIEDMARDLANYRHNIEFNPQRLQAVEERLDLINRLKYKYGDSVDEILKFREKAEQELDTIAHSHEKIDELIKLNSESEREYLTLAVQLSESRQKIARKFQTAVSQELHALEMPAAIIEVEITRVSQGFNGHDKIEFLFTANPGEPLRQLAKIASGGELSRVMLALKSIFAEMDEIPTMIFDEVDSGIGGRALQAVAEKLDYLSQQRQVICVSHAVPIACLAAKHFQVVKQFTHNMTVTDIRELNMTERVEELSRMLGGKNVTSITRDHAKQLLNRSLNKK
jgi:DNA repair protein RecN (Recombination protein N)